VSDDPESLDELLDALPRSLRHKVARHLNGDGDADEHDLAEEQDDEFMDSWLAANEPPVRAIEPPPVNWHRKY